MDTASSIQQLHDWFPDFRFEESERDLPTVVFSFFSSYFKNAIDSDKEVLVQRIIEYLGGLVNSDNTVLESCLDEIALCLDEKTVSS